MSTDDADLADLLASPQSSPNNNDINKPSPPRYDNGDDDKYKKDDPPPRKKNNNLTHRPHSKPRPVNVSLSDYIFAYISLCCHYHPWFCSVILFGIVTLALMLLANLVANPMQEYGILNHDHFNINSKLDLSMGKIDHWCLGGGNDHCRCEDPLTPTSQLERRVWVEAFRQNKRDIQKYRDPLKALELDVAFLGSSIVEEMDGRWLGIERSQPLRIIKRIFENHFRRDHGAEVEGVALGIAGDTSPNVLYRIMHGEMPDYFNPKVWWLVLGLNDLGRMECSEEVTVLGILRVVEEILEAKPDARIVINSLFPMITMRGDKYALISDYEDTFQGNSDTTEGTEVASPPVPDGGGRRLETVFRSFDNAPQRQYNVAYDARAANMSPEELRESIEYEEVLREKRAHLRRPRGRINPLMNENIHRIRKFRPLSAFLAKEKVPLWSSIQAINAELKAFADKQDRVYYFDSTALFAQKQKEGGKYILLTDRISPRGHPTKGGYLLWEDEVVTRLKALLELMKREQPELFVSHELDENHYDEGTETEPTGSDQTEPEEGGTRDPLARDDDAAGKLEMWVGEVDPEYQDDFNQELPPQEASGVEPNGGSAEGSDVAAPGDGGVSVPASEQIADGEVPPPPSNPEPSSDESPQDSTGAEVPEQADTAQSPPADPQHVPEPENPPPQPAESQQESPPDEQNPPSPPAEAQQESQQAPAADQSPPADPQQVPEPENPPPQPAESQQQSHPDEQNPPPPPAEAQQESQQAPAADQTAEGAPA